MNELDLEELAMAWFKDIGYQTLHGPDIEPGGSAQERQNIKMSFFGIVLTPHLLD